MHFIKGELYKCIFCVLEGTYAKYCKTLYGREVRGKKWIGDETRALKIRGWTGDDKYLNIYQFIEMKS